MEPIPVADLDDPRLALYRGVRDPDLLVAHNTFVAEGRLIVQRLLRQSHFQPRSVLVTPTAHARLANDLAQARCPVYLVDASLIEGVTGFNIHRGCLAIGERGTPRSLDDLLARAGPLVCLEAVGNPDNIGGVFRSAAAFGASGIILAPGCSDPLYRKSIRTSMGAALAVPFVTVDEWPGAVVRLRAQGREVIALTPAPDAVEVSRIAAAVEPDRVALLLGHEGSGLSADAQRLASLRVRIATTSAVDSLNVATAAAISLYVVMAGRHPRSSQADPR